MFETTDLGMIDFVFKYLPLPVAIADFSFNIRALNHAAENFFCVSINQTHLKSCGDTIHCINASQPEGCGNTPACSYCQLRNSVQACLQGKVTTRVKGIFNIVTNNIIKKMTMLVTTAPIFYQNKQLAIILVEDTSLITQLQGLLPICSSCHKIRDDNNCWLPLETYIQTHSEAEFTHDYCPQCIEKLILDKKKSPI